MDVLPIRAPIAGTVVRFDKALGQVVGADESLLEIHDLRRVWVKGFLTERDFATLRSGDGNIRARVRFSAARDVVVNGTIRRSAGVLGTVDRTVPLWVELDAAADLELQQNMLARVTVVRGAGKPTLAVPRSAIVRQGGRAYVFVRRVDGVYERRAIEAGRADDLYVEVSSGLALDEPIVVRGAAGLQTAFASVR
jgi:RND family efflux transporter MFP subunit